MGSSGNEEIKASVITWFVKASIPRPGENGTAVREAKCESDDLQERLVSDVNGYHKLKFNIYLWYMLTTFGSSTTITTHIQKIGLIFDELYI